MKRLGMCSAILVLAGLGFAFPAQPLATSTVIREFPVPGGAAGIAAGPDGALWFTRSSPSMSSIGRITTEGSVTNVFSIPTAFTVVENIALGPDGALRFTESMGNKVGRITTSGTITEFPLPTPGSQPKRIVSG